MATYGFSLQNIGKPHRQSRTTSSTFPHRPRLDVLSHIQATCLHTLLYPLSTQYGLSAGQCLSVTQYLSSPRSASNKCANMEVSRMQHGSHTACDAMVKCDGQSQQDKRRTKSWAAVHSTATASSKTTFALENVNQSLKDFVRLFFWGFDWGEDKGRAQHADSKSCNELHDDDTRTIKMLFNKAFRACGSSSRNLWHTGMNILSILILLLGRELRAIYTGQRIVSFEATFELTWNLPIGTYLQPTSYRPDEINNASREWHQHALESIEIKRLASIPVYGTIIRSM